jgi:hypothetical protein
MVKEVTGNQVIDNQGQIEIVAGRRAHLIVTKDALNVEIETQLTKKLTTVGYWVVTSVLTLVLGSIIGSVYTMNGKLNEISGKYSSPENLIQHIGTRIEKLETENKQLIEELNRKEIEDLREQINKLSKKDNHGY